MLRKSFLPAILAMVLGSVSAIGADQAQTFDVRIKGRTVTDPGDTIRVKEGDTVVLRWHTDEAATLHVHGYDVEVELVPGAPVETRLEATASGRFPVTSHRFAGESDHGHRALLYIEVHPQ